LNLSATAVSSSQINLNWGASKDNLGVTGYNVFRAGSQVGTTASTSYLDSGLSPSTAYSYTVSAFDGAGNNSLGSGTAWATTLGDTALSIRVVSPTPGSPVYDVRPTIIVAYASPDSTLNLTTLSVRVDGVDWTSRFNVGPDKATYAIAVEDALVAGTRTIEASIADATATASVTQAYDVFPTFTALSPTTAAVGQELALGVLGLDPNTPSDEVTFRSLYNRDGTTVPMTTADAVADRGTTFVPADTETGPVSVKVNGNEARETFLLKVQRQWAQCGGVGVGIPPGRLLAMADGSFLASYWGGYDSFYNDPRCPFGRTDAYAVIRLRADGSATMVYQPPAGSSEALRSVAVDKTGVHHAILSSPIPPGCGSDCIDTLMIRYKGVTTTVSSTAFQHAADFDYAGNLYIATFERQAPFIRILRIPATALATGGQVTPEEVKSGLEYLDGIDCNVISDFRVSCDGSAYIGVWVDTHGSCWEESFTSRIRKVDLLTGTVGDILINNGIISGLALTCNNGELWGTTMTDANLEDIELWRSQDGASPLRQAFFPEVYRSSALAIAPGGRIYFDHKEGILPLDFTACPPPFSSILSEPFPCRDTDIKILPSTTRWRPQRDPGRDTATQELAPIRIEFTSTSPLQRATVTLTGPSAVDLLEATFEPQNPPNPYVVAWTVPSEPGNPASYLQRGDYTIVVNAVTAGGRSVSSSPQDANSRISLVEVTAVEICEDSDGGTSCVPLRTPYPDISPENPAVPNIAGQDPRLDRPGGGKRIFAEALAPYAAPRNRVKVRASEDPTLEDLRGQPPVTVHYVAFDVDDPAGKGNQVDKDFDINRLEVEDNRGTPTSGMPQDPSVLLMNGQSRVATTLSVSGQPGDNYRVAASTARTWLSEIGGYQPSLTGELRHRDSDATALTEDELNSVSEMLTVWRTLHLEVDSMTEPPADPTAPERNFIQGEILALNPPEGFPTLEPNRAVLAPEATEVPLALADGSPDHDQGAGGRFEHGRLCIGALGTPPLQPNGLVCTAPAVTVIRLDGNGSNYVQREAGIHVPVTLEPPDGSPLPPLTSSIASWDRETAQVRLTEAGVPAGYAHGTLVVGGGRFAVSGLNEGTVQLGADARLPFYLVDDDSVSHPFSIHQTDYLRAGSDDPTQNILAQAYVTVRYDLPNFSSVPAFRRNLNDTLEDWQRQLLQGRDKTTVSTPSFWAMYLQGAFQASAVQDNDPDGETPVTVGATPSFTDEFGTLILVETIQDALRLLPQCPWLLAETTAHELGHQFGMRHREGGVMQDEEVCTTEHFYGDYSLTRIRGKGVVP
jgi:hypothetical protein